MNVTGISSFFILGILGGFSHCVGMCHPFVLYVSSRFPPSTQQKQSHAIIPHVLYNCGRITTYTSLGLLCGIIGKISGDLMEFQGIAALIAGGFLIIYGTLGLTSKTIKKKIESNTLTKAFVQAIQTVQPKNPFLFGLILGFLPCGLIYGALAGALALSNPLSGGLAMAQFGLGTAVAMITISFFSNFLAARRGMLEKISMLFLIGMGGYFIFRVLWG